MVPRYSSRLRRGNTVASGCLVAVARPTGRRRTSRGAPRRRAAPGRTARPRRCALDRSSSDRGAHLVAPGFLERQADAVAEPVLRALVRRPRHRAAPRRPRAPGRRRRRSSSSANTSSVRFALASARRLGQRQARPDRRRRASARTEPSAASWPNMAAQTHVQPAGRERRQRGRDQRDRPARTAADASGSAGPKRSRRARISRPLRRTRMRTSPRSARTPGRQPRVEADQVVAARVVGDPRHDHSTDRCCSPRRTRPSASARYSSAACVVGQPRAGGRDRRRRRHRAAAGIARVRSAPLGAERPGDADRRIHQPASDRSRR